MSIQESGILKIDTKLEFKKNKIDVKMFGFKVSKIATVPHRHMLFAGKAKSIHREGSNSWEKAAALIGVLLRCHPSAQTRKCSSRIHNVSFQKLLVTLFQ